MSELYPVADLGGGEELARGRFLPDKKIVIIMLVFLTKIDHAIGCPHLIHEKF